MTTLGLGWLSTRHGSLHAALAYLRGERLLLVPETLDIGEGKPGEHRDGWLQVVNLSDRPARIVGMNSSCNCIVVREQVPGEIPGRGSMWLPVSVNFEGERRELSHSVTVYTDLPDAGSATAQIKGRVRTASAATK